MTRTFSTAASRFAFSLALGVAMLAAIHTGPAEARRPAPTPTPTATPVPTPSPSPTPTPLSLDARVARLNDQLVALAHGAPGMLGISVYDPESDTHISIRGDKPFPLAGEYRLAVALAAYRRYEQRKLSLDAVVGIVPADLRRGHSPIAETYPSGGVSMTYWQLIRAMLVDNDTTATDLVVRAIGTPADVESELSAANLAGFDIRKSEAELYADASAQRTFAKGGDNAGTPDGIAALLSGVASLKFLGLDATTEFMLALSQARAGDERIRAGFPPHTPFAHKIATTDVAAGLTDATNDAGIVTMPDGHRITIVAFLNASNADAAGRDAIFADVGRYVYAAFAP